MSDRDPFKDIEVQILRAQPGDIVALRATRPMSPDQAAMVREQATRVAPEGITFMVLDGLTVDRIIRPEVAGQ